eukprot:2684762-Pleurochrysis_carterae.AAC.1
MVGVVFPIVLRGVRGYDRVGVGLFEQCGRRLSVWKWCSYGNRDRWSVRKRCINGPERNDGFRDVVVHVRRVGGCAERRPATVRSFSATALACVGGVRAKERR